ncbi:MAG: hypothetical protein GY902_10255 [Planctomycetes bacterium]|nr:hypothetical protein [Planctomycetota bacterium]
MNKRLIPLLLVAGVIALAVYLIRSINDPDSTTNGGGTTPPTASGENAELEQAELENNSDIPLPDSDLSFEPQALERSEFSNAALIVDVVLDSQGTTADSFDLLLVDFDEEITTLHQRSEHVDLANISNVEYVCARGPEGWSKMYAVADAEDIDGTPHVQVTLDQPRVGFQITSHSSDGVSTANAKLTLEAINGVAVSYLRSSLASAKMDADTTGTFRLEEMPPAVYEGSLTLAGHVPQTLSIDLREASDHSLDVSFEPSGSTSGRIVSEGKGLAETTVALLSADFQDNLFGFGLDDFRSVGEMPDAVEAFNITTTDANGNFQLSLAAAGEYQILVAAEGFLPLISADPITVIAHENTDCGDIEMELGFGLNLVVVDSKAIAVPDVSVRWYRNAGSNLVEARRRGTVEQHTTNDRGVLKLRGLPAAQITLELTHPDYAHLVLEHDFSGRTKKTNDPLEVVLQVGASVAGSVIDGRSGMPIADASLELHTTSNNSGFGALIRGSDWDATSGQDGKFDFAHLPSDEYILIARHSDFAETQVGPLTVEGSAVENITVMMHPGGTLLVSVLDSDGVGIAEATVQAVNTEAQQVLTGDTDEEGLARIENVAPGNYQIAFTDISAFDTDNNTGNIDVRFKFVTVEENQEVEVVLGGPILSADVEGVVRMGSELINAATVAIITDSGIKTDSSDETGAYKIEGVPLGAYTILVRTGLPLRGGSTFYDYIAIDHEGTITRDIDIPNAGVEITVIGAADRIGLASIPVTVRPMDGSNISGGDFGLTDEAGVVRFPSLPAGEYIISAGNAAASFLASSEAGFGSLQKSHVFIEEGSGIQKIEMALQLGATFKVQVTDPEGNLLSGVHMHYLDAEGQPLNILSFKGTNSKGVAEMTGLPAGPGIIHVRHPQLGSKEIQVNLKAGEATKQRVQLERGTVVYVSVTDASGAPQSGVLATALDRRGSPISYLWSQEETQATNAAFFSGGEQKLGPLPDGDYLIQLYRPGNPPVRHVVAVKGEQEMHLSLPYSAE